MDEAELTKLSELLMNKFPGAKVTHHVDAKQLRITTGAEGLDALAISRSLKSKGIVGREPYGTLGDNIPIGPMGAVADNYHLIYDARAFEGKTHALRSLPSTRLREPMTNSGSFSNIAGQSR